MTNSALKVLIVDDEPPARRKIRKFLAQDVEVTIVGEVGSGDRAIAEIRKHSPDVVFLDIQMGKIDGFGVIEALEDDALPQIVFVTAHDEYALRAFEVAAVDYLLKPFDAERFAQALERVKRRARAGSAAQWPHEVHKLLSAIGRGRDAPRRLLVKSRDRALLVNVNDIAWVRAAGNYVELHVGGAEYLLRETLDALGQQLDPETFLRVHRSFLVNAAHVGEIQSRSHGDHLIVMRDRTMIPLSRRFRNSLPEAICRNL